MNTSRGSAASWSMLASAARPRFQVVIQVKTAAPTAMGNQPPSEIFTTLAEKKDRSTVRNSKVSAQARPAGHRHTSRATRCRRTVVIVMVPVTAMP